MREVLNPLLTGWQAGGIAGLATVVRTFQSAPRSAGASMLVTADGEVVGSVSGGCVESAVYDLATQVIDDGRPVLVRYGISDDDAFSVGLTCGGILDVFVEPVSQVSFPELSAVEQDITGSAPVGVATVIEHPDPSRLGRHLIIRPHGFDGDLGSERANRAIGDDARGLLAAGRNSTLTYGPDGERRGEGMRVFVNSYAPRPRMLVFGAIDFAAALARLASFLGYHVTVCDAREVFATPARFPEADEVIVGWPHRYLAEQVAAGLVDERTVVCVLTHDPKFDVPLLKVALTRGPFAYIGAMGSRRTHEDRLARLREAGVDEAELTRLHSPIGLDLGSRTPEETAVSIAAEIIAEQWGGTGDPLGNLADRIHHDDLDEQASV
ncbi:XdhC/CoxI family protein [Cryobacterium sp. TMT2-18-3]|uniref:XdhC family protein n=1 Tax=unclassified Cryobacterium TaxID=2649013 RepID=UPI00106A866C|nr:MULTISPECIES: XdhC/CoxI family protein [unclassified Cryobacterium]TFC27861.1 XdhC/CoxI family protein [Cryobacterium sp. TMT2-18-2]TFC36534.1 XdhC/CoxI family protein [Cryobacterium sp. TMT2-42-4]TFC63183.1 XdhC/CoxI family protein [Cryobacterium sp. TMT2-18-3]TFC64684.1 XdhC/CoxI family protein [Cryobacterium sp. TMT2-15-1]